MDPKFFFHLKLKFYGNSCSGMLVTGDARKFFCKLTVFAVSLFNIAGVVANMQNTANFLYDLTGVPTWHSKIMVGLIFILVIALTVETEKLSIFAIPS